MIAAKNCLKLVMKKMVNNVNGEFMKSSKKIQILLILFFEIYKYYSISNYSQ